jgi:hypothetical protein
LFDYEMLLIVFSSLHYHKVVVIERQIAVFITKVICISCFGVIDMSKIIKVESFFLHFSSGCFGFAIGVIGQLFHNSSILSKDIVDVAHDRIVVAICFIIEVIATLVIAKLFIGPANKFFSAIST